MEHLTHPELTSQLPPLPDWRMPIEAWTVSAEARLEHDKATIANETARMEGWRAARHHIEDVVDEKYSIAQFRDPVTRTLRNAYSDPNYHPPDWDAYDNDYLPALTELEKEIEADMATNGDPIANIIRAEEDQHRATTQLEAAVGESPSMLVYYDEVDPSSVEVYLTGHPTPDNFRLPPTENPPTDPEEVVRILNNRPFLHPNEIRQLRPNKNQFPNIVVRGVTFPVDRIISADGFDAWSGRGTKHQMGPYSHPVPDGGGDKGLEPGYVQEGFEETSRGAIAAYARQPIEKLDVTDVIEIIRDANGEYWGIAHGGNHRTAAAILRGQAEIPATTIQIPSPEDIVQLPFSVRDRFGAQQLVAT